MYFSKIFLSNHVRLFQYLIIFLAYWSITANAGNHREKHIPIEFKTDGQDLKPIINNSRFALIAIVPEDNPSFFEVKITLEDNTLSQLFPHDERR
ncbi:hypothetical protein [Endozoicomonas sp. Mp262]|uniref:hypothetical protein n=1 Tax=Endozoicomonas sp. Mp262 TaxID=2919499 RepID=UPI0021D7E386